MCVCVSVYVCVCKLMCCVACVFIVLIVVCMYVCGWVDVGECVRACSAAPVRACVTVSVCFCFSVCVCLCMCRCQRVHPGHTGDHLTVVINTLTLEWPAQLSRNELRDLRGASSRVNTEVTNKIIIEMNLNLNLNLNHCFTDDDDDDEVMYSAYIHIIETCSVRSQQ